LEKKFEGRKNFRKEKNVKEIKVKNFDDETKITYELKMKKAT